MNSKIEEYWSNFKKANNLNDDLNYYESFGFGITDEDKDKLLDLVLKGKKIATTSPYFEDENNVKVGDYSIVLDSKDEPRCIIQTTNIQILKFNEATFELIKDEGEDEILDTWVNNHKKFLKDYCKEYNKEYKDDMNIIFEHFKIIHI